MVTFFYGNEIEAINWKIAKFCFNNNLLPYKFDSNFTFDEIVKKIFQLDLFDSGKNIVYIIDFSKVKTEQEKSIFLTKLVNCEKKIILFYRNNNFDKKLFDKKTIVVEKIFPLSSRDKNEIIYFFLNQNKIKISKQNIEYMHSSLLNDHYFIGNEINKISLLVKTFPINSINIRYILLDCFNLNVFRIIDLWLQKKYSDLLKSLNEIAYNSSQAQWVIQVFITKIIQIKMFILAVQSNINEQTITNNLQLSIFQQKIYKKSYLSTKGILGLINKVLTKLWDLEKGIKTNEMHSFFTFVRILLDDRYDK